MLIKPFKKSLDDAYDFGTTRNGYVLSKDYDGEVFYKKDRFLLNDIGSCRYESIKIYPKKKTLIKECAFGEHKILLSGNAVNPVNFMSTILDTETGEIKQYGSKSIIPSINNPDEPLWCGYFGIEPPSLYVMKEETKVFRGNLQDVNSVTKRSKILEEISTTEDIFQNNYFKTIGLLNSFFMQWGYLYPFEAIVTIDSIKGFNLNSFKYLKGLLSEKASLELGKRFVTQCDRLTDLFKENFKDKHRSYKVQAFVGSFGSIVKLKSSDHIFQFTFPTSNSDYSLELFKNNLNKSYYLSEEQGLLLKNDPLSYISDEMIQRIDYWNM